MSENQTHIPVIRVRDILMVTMPPEPDDSTVAALQDRVLSAMERNAARGVILDISSVETLDSFFAKVVMETANMVTLMGGQTVIAGMRPRVAMTAVEMGLKLPKVATSLSVDRALEWYENAKDPATIK
jgi:rsbT antagonist protein RsbS